MYKFSKYNFKFHRKGNDYIYNARTGAFVEIEGGEREFYDRYSFSENEKIDADILSRNEDLKNNFEYGGIIIDSDIDELKLLKATSKMNSEENSFALTIAPTLGCNFRCPYCFEKWNNYPDGNMSTEVQDRIIELIETKVPERGNLAICWYGGEPLLGMDIIVRLQSRINRLCEKKNIALNASIITNGYLLTPTVCKRLCDLGICDTQITLDGCERVHNRTRYLKNGDGTFAKIIENLQNLDGRMNVSVRVNINRQNIGENKEFIAEMEKYNLVSKENVTFYYALIRDSFKEDYLNKDELFNVQTFSRKETELLKEAIGQGLNVHPNIEPKTSSCGAISPRSFVIEPDGTLQKCYEYVGDREKAAGSILEDSDLSPKNVYKNNIDWYSWSPFDSDSCLTCKVLPLCFGGCPMCSIDENVNEGNYRCLNAKYNLLDMLDLTLELQEVNEGETKKSRKISHVHEGL